MLRRINFFAGPGSGKSTLCTKLYSYLKSEHIEVEYVPEYIKSWAYEGRKPTGFDQLYVMAKQLHQEEVFLRNVRLIVSDSPIYLGACFSKFFGLPYADEVIELAKKFDKIYRPINFFIDRSVNYIQKGRYESYEQAIQFDSYLKSFLSQHLTEKCHHVTINDFEKIVSMVKTSLDKNDMASYI